MMVKYTLAAAIGAALVAALALWWGMHQRDARRDAEAALEAQDRVIAALNNYAVTVRDIEATLRDGMEAINAAPDTNTCGEPVNRALQFLRPPER